MILYPDTTPLKTALRKIDPATALPLDIERVANYLRTDLSEDLLGLESLLERAAEEVERFTGKALINATYRYTLSDWPKTVNGYVSRIIELPRSPLVSVSSVQYYDADNVLQTLSTDSYAVGLDFEPGCIYLNKEYEWPEIYERLDAVQIVFVAGAGTDPNAISASVKQAMLLLCRAEFAGGNPNTNASSEDDVRAAMRILDGQRVTGWTV